MLKRIIICLLLLLPLLNQLILPVQAATNVEDKMNSYLDTVAGDSYGSADETTMALIIQQIITVILSLLGVIFLILMIWSGYNWMTAGGEEEKIKKAQSTIKRAIIGLIIVVSAYAISYFVFNALTISTTGQVTTGISSP
jgi:amino acid transporter